MSELHNQLVVCEHQLNKAIELFLDEEDYYCSATLAGAAEEILGALLSESGKEHTLQNSINTVLRMLSSDEVEALTGSRSQNPQKQGALASSDRS